MTQKTSLPPTHHALAGLGRFQSDDVRFSGRLDATIVWSNGRPVAIDIEKS
jgi:hypothetical protein